MKMKTDFPEKLFIITENGNVFDTEMTYEIPLYQRGYAWKEKQLTQLLEDIQDVKDGMDYYIGSLVVSRHDNVYEVVDGQQRLTSLFMLLNCLGIETKKTLKFACRERANQTLEHIEDLIRDDLNGQEKSRLELDKMDGDILEGIQILKQKIEILKKQKNLNLIDKLKRVILYRIELPAHTDLNRYFEIMNTRGEQLEQHDIVKAKLMQELSAEEGRLFSQIWDACRDMTGYVQMHFSPSIRRILFGEDWTACPDGDWQMFYEKWHKAQTDEKKEVPRIECADEDEEKTLLECLKSNYGRMPEETDEESKEKERIVYDGIVDFSVFLLHVLKIYVAEKGLKVELPQELDDKKLIECFDRASSKDAEFSKDFAMYLLKIRFLFDAYVIKREYKYTYEKPDSEWSLKKLRSYVSGRSRSADYMHSFDEKCYDRLIMIQACFRVAYTSPKTMHWLTKVLRYLFQQKNAIIDGENYVNQLENMARSIVKDLLDDDKTYLGVGTQNIVFHYLDYLLWKADWETGGSKYNNFVFEFRDSVEHFYPQNPSNGSFDKWDEMISIGGEEFREVDQFGNLALLTSGQNSRLSNQDPAYKVTKLKDAITKGSIKLRIMSEILDELTKSEGMEGACKKWKDSECKKHGNEMLQLLRNDCEARGKGIS